MRKLCIGFDAVVSQKKVALRVPKRQSRGLKM
jgi:hypothetical protein